MLAFTKHLAAPKLNKANSILDLVIIIRKSPFRKSQLTLLAKKLELSSTHTARVAGVSLRTYQRQKADSGLSVNASESILRLAEVYQNGLTAFDNSEKSFLAWIKEPIPALNYAIPQDLMTTVLGAEIVNEELQRIEYSVFS